MTASELPAPHLAPVEARQRIEAIDVLRGVALLGILVMNVVAFALPDAAYSNPLYGGGFDGLDRLAWEVSHLFFEMKMMTIFSMLFGAGLILLGGRAGDNRRELHRVWFRRLGWLALIGLAHGDLLWWGDILYTYAVCGFALWPFRAKSGRALLAWGSGFVLLGMVLGVGAGFHVTRTQAKADAAEARLAAGASRRDLTSDERKAIASWTDMREGMAPTDEQLARDVATKHGGYWDLVVVRVPQMLMPQTVFLVLFLLWRIGGTMLIGMGLMKLGVLSAERSTRFYLGLAGAGYGLGLPLVFGGMRALESHRFAVAWAFTWGGLPNGFGSFGVALGHVAVVMLAVKSGVLRALAHRLAAVGRMAFTNYLAHTVICTTLFYGYGFDLFGRFGRAELLLFVLAIWIAQLAWSPWWLARFRFGPAEWAWRSLTYGARQPMRRVAANG